MPPKRAHFHCEEEEELFSRNCASLREELAKMGLGSLGHKDTLVARVLRGRHAGRTANAKREKPRAPLSIVCDFVEPNGPVTDPCFLPLEVFTSILSLLDLSSLHACMTVSKTWFVLIEKSAQQLWPNMFAKYSLQDCGSSYASCEKNKKMWFAAHYVALLFHKDVDKDDDDDFDEGDMVRFMRATNTRRCRFCKYSIMPDSLFTGYDFGSMSWSSVHCACCTQESSHIFLRMIY